MVASDIEQVTNGAKPRRGGPRIVPTEAQEQYILQWYGRLPIPVIARNVGLSKSTLTRHLDVMAREGRITRIGTGKYGGRGRTAPAIAPAAARADNARAARHALSANGSATVWNPMGQAISEAPREAAKCVHFRLSGQEVLRKHLPEVEQELGAAPDGWQREVCVRCGDVQIVQMYDEVTHGEVTGRQRHEALYPGAVTLAQERGLGPWHYIPSYPPVDGPPQAEEIEGTEEETQADWGPAPDFDPEQPEREHVSDEREQEALPDITVPSVRVSGWVEYAEATREPVSIEAYRPSSAPATEISNASGQDLLEAVERLARRVAEAEEVNRGLRLAAQRDRETITAMEIYQERLQERIDGLVGTLTGIRPVGGWGPQAVERLRAGRPVPYGLD